MFNDERIVCEVRAALARDRAIPHPAEVAVSSHHGTVTLRGTVGSLHQRHAVVKAARSTGGVAYVVDELSLDLRDRWGDDEIRGRALQALMSADNVPAQRIEIRVAEAWLTLKGEVKHQYENDAAFEAVRQVPGVGGITNEIRVVTAGLDG